MVTNYYFLFICFIISSFTVSGLYHEIITPDPIYRHYATKENSCLFTYSVLCVAQNSGEVCGSNLTVSPTTPGTNSERILYNETSAIYSLNLFANTNVGTFDIDSNYKINVQCIELDLNSISFKLQGSYFIFPNPVSSWYITYGVYKLEGVDMNSSDITLTSQVNGYTGAYLDKINKNYFSFVSSFTLLPNSISTTLSLSITTFSSASKTFILEPFIKDNQYVNITNMNTFPKDMNTIELFGKDHGPILEYTTNASVSNLQIFTSDGSSVFNNIKPIRGDSKSTTYLYGFGNYGLTKNYALYSQNGTSASSIQSFQLKLNQFKIATPQLPTTVALDPYIIDKPIISTKFTTSIKYGLGKIEFDVEFNRLTKSFPYGFLNGSASNYTFGATHLVLPYNYDGDNNYISYKSNLDFSSFKISFPPFTSMVYDTSLLPKIYSYEAIRLVSDSYLFRVGIQSSYGFSSIAYQCIVSGFKGSESRVSGNQFDGVYEFICSVLESIQISVYDIYGGYSIYKNGQPVSVNPVKLFKSPINYDFDFYSIKNVSFLYNNINVTNHRHYNVLYFNYDNAPKDTQFKMIAMGIDTIQDAITIQGNAYFNERNFFYSSYNQELKSFQIEFYVDANVQCDEFVFSLVYENILYSPQFNTRLVIKETTMDLQGPVFKAIDKINQIKIVDDVNAIEQVGWLFTIEDSINGFKYGYITVRGELDQSIYNFTITSNDVLPGGDIFMGQYQINIQVAYPCISQMLVITEVVLYDQMDRISLFSISPPSGASFSYMVSPFIYLLDNSTINKIQVTCTPNSIASIDTTPPVLDSFTLNSTAIDVGKTIREIEFTFKATDLQSGIKLGQQNPIVYLSTSNNRVLECISNIAMITTDNTQSPYGNSVSYSCTIQLPLGFGYPQGIFVSVYGFINNNGYFSGFSTDDLNKQGYSFSIDTLLESNEPTISSHFRVTEKGGDLWLFGKSLWSSGTTTTAFIKFSDDNSTLKIDSTISYSSAIKFSNIKATSKSYQVYIVSNGLKSNSITVIPTIYDFYINTQPSSPSSSSSSTDTPLPTNKPQSCPGNPICGGPSNGICVANQGCVCLSGRVGLDCSSEIIIIDPPKTNDTSPSTNITLPVSDGSSSTTVTYKSLITLVSIRELDVSGKPIFSKSFEKWQVTPLQSDNTTLIYNTTLEINKNNQISTTSFKVTLNWFTQESNITFANEQLIMNPSTMKYTIEISNYPFDSALNHLQLVMSASIQSDSKDNSVCSVREFGETTSGDNSNYLKIQVDNHSLYGRFIRRGIVDSTIRSITNVLLDKDMNSITTTKQLQSFIGIEIPHFNDNATIDPDFSVLIDSKSASSKSNSICSKSKLSGAKIAGIVIGCVAFVAVIVVAITYHIIKKKKDSKFITKVNQKMKNMNNDKL